MDTIRFKNISQVHQALGLQKPMHPLVTVVRGNEIKQVGDFQNVKVVFDLYQVVLKKGRCGNIRYGRNSYDYQEGTLLFMEPGQVMEFENNFDPNEEVGEGWTLGFHPDLALKANLSKKLESYSFFHYDSHEALHLSDAELKTIEELLDKIVKEYNQNIDRHSQNIIATNIELLLDYCLRFYDRQFYTRSNINSDVVSKFHKILKQYYSTNFVQSKGLPTVHFLANELNLTPSYLGDLIKKETSISAQEHIHNFVIEKAKVALLQSSEPVSHIGYSLGFDYPQHFSNLFKTKTGFSPSQFRNVN